MSTFTPPPFLIASLLAAAALHANADAVTDWNVKAGEIIAESRLGTPPAIRVMAIVQTAVHEALIGLPSHMAIGGPAVDAAVAAAHRAALNKLLPAQQPATDAAYQAALAAVADGPAKAAGMAAGERAAAAVMAARADDGPAGAEAYRPLTSAGVYVPTATPAVPQWPQRKPWLMAAASQFRPNAPPPLTGEQWARDYNEVKSLGARTSSRRSAEQTEIARFWEYSLPSIYFGVVRSVARLPGRDPVRNARLFAAVAQAMDDAMIGVFDAKYHYNFWRPATAIRNGDIDGHAATDREPNWTSFIETPMHPEYPGAHSVLAGSVGAVLQAEVGADATPVLETASPTAKGMTRRWKRIDGFVHEVSNARVYGGVHFRFSTEAGHAMGRQIGLLAAERILRSAP
jgi:hypothetical protein